MSKFRILSIDGGGLRGIIPVKILRHIESITETPIYESFDLISGTSTGGLIACGISYSLDGLTPVHSLEHIESIYEKRGGEIFPQRGLVSRLFNKATTVLTPKYSPEGLEAILTEMFTTAENKQSRLSECSLVPVLVTSYDIINNEPLYFNARYALQGDGNCNPKLFDVCRATSAGPTYFPAHPFRYDNRNVLGIDGGVFMNNPSMGALVEAWKHRDKSPYNAGDVPNDEIYLLSISTGHFTGRLLSDNAATKWGGYKNWVLPLFDTLLSGPNQAVDKQAKESLTFNNGTKVNYMRIKIDIDEKEHSEMDNSTETTRDYLISQVKEQYLDNSTLQNQLNTFLLNAGII